MRDFLVSLNPLTKLFAAVPALVMLLVISDPGPLSRFALLVCGAAVLLVLMCVRLTRGQGFLLLAIPVATAVFTISISVWGVGDSWGEKLQYGFATALRLTAVFMAFLPATLSTTGPDLVRASVQQGRLPYRIGWTMLASSRFIPRFRSELATIRAAHRVRGVTRGTSFAVPLLAGGLRHAERVALAMDSRAFGAHHVRTERRVLRWRVRDTAFLCCACASTVAAVVLAFQPFNV